MTESTRKSAKQTLPDYEAALRQNARRVLLDMGAAPDQVDAEWERLSRQPLPFDLPSNDELDDMAARDKTQDPHAAE
jgi:hypothetical protein